MASLRPSSLFQKAACRRSWLQLGRQFAVLRIGPARTTSRAGGSRILIQARHSSTSRHNDGLTDSDLIPAGFPDDTSSLDDLLEQLNSGIDGVASEAVRRAPLKQIQPRLAGYARPLPMSPSYFSRQPRFNDRFLRLQELFRRFGHLPSIPAEQVERVAWKSLRDYRHDTGEDIKAPQYNKCIAIVKHLHKIHPSLKPPGVVEMLGEFLRDVNPFANVAKTLTIDRFGRAIGVGRRKTSVARAWVVEGTGEVLVNGKSLSKAFGRVHDRESATWALRATERTDKYNVWALVEGGGTTGQAEALTLAVAKGLVAHEPALKTALRKAGCIARDPRMVERKKHGHVKARKMPAWVKR